MYLRTPSSSESLVLIEIVVETVEPVAAREEQDDERQDTQD